MIDQDYFKTHLTTQYETLSQATVTVVLHNGSLFPIQKVVNALDAYVLLAVYPMPNTKTERAKRINPKTGDVTYDQIALPYQAISYIHLTLEETTDTDDERAAMGFCP